MTTIETKNEAEFLASSHELKNGMFEKMCNSILGNYNKLTKQRLKLPTVRDLYKNSDQGTLIRLFCKMHHIAFSLYSPQSLPGMLQRIVTKPIKVISKPEYKEAPEIYGKGHFRWDFKAYTLDENELQAIRIYLGLHVTQEPVKLTYAETGAKPDFEVITGYHEQAEAFLAWTGTSFTTEFKEHSTYFPDDKETRDIYIVILKNKAHKYRFNFGQSIANTGKAPKPYDILACIEKHPVYDFADFCSNYGYEVDSRAAFKTYKAVKKEWENVNKLFTEDQLELLREIQ